VVRTDFLLRLALNILLSAAEAAVVVVVVGLHLTAVRLLVVAAVEEQY
jgi:hypothetical protein